MDQKLKFLYLDGLEIYLTQFYMEWWYREENDGHCVLIKM